MKIGFLWKMIAVTEMIFLAACAGQPAAVTQPAAITQPGSGAPAVTSPATRAAAIPVTSTEGAATVTAQNDPAGAAQAQPTRPQAGQPAAVTQPAAIDCTGPAPLTPPMTEGPYFKAGSPKTNNLASNLPGTKLNLSGYVLTTDCQPVANAKIEFWQADGQGRYDNNDYTLRGHLFTGADGSYQLITVVPGLYPGRTEHIHVKVQAPGGPEQTTQLFFPGVAQNEADSIFDQSLLINVLSTEGEMTATYNFVAAAQ